MRTKLDTFARDLLHGCCTDFRASRRAADGSRTRDIDLGKVALYQLSYRRKTADLTGVTVLRGRPVEVFRPA